MQDKSEERFKQPDESFEINHKQQTGIQYQQSIHARQCQQKWHGNNQKSGINPAGFHRRNRNWGGR